MTPETIFAWTQSILAFVVVIGCGLLIMFSDVDPAILVGTASLVIGYFFGSAVAPAGMPLKRPNGTER